MTLSEFFSMGGYAVFVWSSYGLALVVLLINWWLPYQQHKQNLKKLKRQYRQDKRDHDTSA
jgi:heme exporter protein D